MLASTRRTRTTRRTLAAAAALSLGLAACGADDTATTDDDTAEVDAPADDDGVDELDEDIDGTVDGAEEPEAAPPAFEDLEDGEVVPGVYLDVPVDESVPVQAQPTPVGSAYVAALTDQTGAVSLNVEFDGADLDELLVGIEELVEAGQAEIAEGPDDIEVEGADEASRVELAAPGGGATATGIFAIADGHAISLAVEVTDESEVDVEAIIDSLRIDTDRIEMAGTAEMPDVPDDGTDPDAGTDADAGTDPEGVDPDADDAGTDADGAAPDDDTDAEG